MLFRKKWMMRASHTVCKRCLLAECILRLLSVRAILLKVQVLWNASLDDNAPTFRRLQCLFKVSHFRLVDFEDYVIATHAQTSVTSQKTWNYVSDCQGKWTCGNCFLLHSVLVHTVATFSCREANLICGNKMPTRCNRGFYCRSYCLLNMFRASLCPSSGAHKYYTVVAACGISCCKNVKKK